MTPPLRPGGEVTRVRVTAAKEACAVANIVEAYSGLLVVTGLGAKIDANRVANAYSRGKRVSGVMGKDFTSALAFIPRAMTCTYGPSAFLDSTADEAVFLCLLVGTACGWSDLILSVLEYGQVVMGVRAIKRGKVLLHRFG